MLPTTAEAVRALLKSDPTLTPTDRQRIVNTIREHGRTPEKESAAPAVAPSPRILRRAEAAERMGCSLRAIDHWTSIGFLHKVRLPGRVRSVGFRESDICELIAQGAALGAGAARERNGGQGATTR